MLKLITFSGVTWVLPSVCQHFFSWIAPAVPARSASLLQKMQKAVRNGYVGEYDEACAEKLQGVYQYHFQKNQYHVDRYKYFFTKGGYDAEIDIGDSGMLTWGV